MNNEAVKIYGIITLIIIILGIIDIYIITQKVESHFRENCKFKFTDNCTFVCEDSMHKYIGDDNISIENSSLYPGIIIIKSSKCKIYSPGFFTS